jgi:hypothetical protein
MLRHRKPVVPRNGHTLVVGIVARISGCQNQKELSLEDQIDHGKEVATEYYEGPIDYRVVATKGKGERLDRPELQQIEEMLRSEVLDFLIAEDIGRMVRGAEAIRLCGIAVDHGTRVIAPNDCIDTIDDHWEEDVISACRDHVGHNSHTSKRLKDKLMNRFKNFGGSVALPVAGYYKDPGAKSYDDWRKDPAATPIFQEWFRRLREKPNCSAVADWLNEIGFGTGPYASSERWDGRMIGRLTRNPILKGMPARGFRRTRKFHELGRRLSVPNPDGPIYYHAPHLAHVDPIEFDAVNDLLKMESAKYRRKLVNGVDPLLHRPRKRTRFPAQHAHCWYCGRQYVWGANGVTENLMCSGAREWNCWNSIGFPGALAAERILWLLNEQLYALEGFDTQFRATVERAQQSGCRDMTQLLMQINERQLALDRKRENLAAGVAEWGRRPEFAELIAQIELESRELTRERCELEAHHNRQLELPGSVMALRELFEQKSRELAVDSSAFGDVLRQLVPEFSVHLVRLCDGGHPLPRARISLDLGGMVKDIGQALELSQFLRREVTIDLFEGPPQRERIRAVVAELEARGVKQRDIARQIAERPKQAAVHRALALDRLMRERGLDSPYVLLLEPPDDYPKLRRHRNPRYRFEPREGYERQPL